MADNMANAMTGLRGEDRLDFATQTGAGTATGQKNMLNAGLAGLAAEGAVTGSGVVNASAAATQANVGLDKAFSAQTYSNSAQVMQTAMKMQTTGGDFKKEAE